MSKVESNASFKKKPGKLLLTDYRFQWQSNESEQPEFIVPYDLIKAQHVNLAGSGKILLKLTLSAQKSVPESNHTFSFDTPEDREVIKEYLTQKLSSVKSNLVSDGNRKASIIAGNLKKTYPISASEIRARQALLSRDSELKKFHEELVVNGVIEEDQFWESRKQQLVQQQFLSVQKKGSTSASLADIKPTSVDGADIKYTLTPDIIHSIFVHHPAVQNAYQENVPLKMNETDFWKQYFLSSYFHGGKSLATATIQTSAVMKSANELFEKYAVDEDVYTARTEGIQVKNKLIDLTATAEDHLKDFGNQPDSTMKAGKVKESMPLIRKFNRHSEIVLKSSMQSSNSLSGTSLFLQETELEDLEIERDGHVYSNLNYIDPSKYFHLQNSQRANLDSNQTKEFYAQVTKWNGDLSNLATEESRSQLDTKLMLNFHQSVLKRKRQVEGHEEQSLQVPPETMLFIRSSYQKANELLRHFWSNMSGITLKQLSLHEQEEKRLKCQRIVAALQELKVVHLSLVDAQNPTDQHIVSELLHAIQTCIHIAIHRFNSLTNH